MTVFVIEQNLSGSLIYKFVCCLWMNKTRAELVAAILLWCSSARVNVGRFTPWVGEKSQENSWKIRAETEGCAKKVVPLKVGVGCKRNWRAWWKKKSKENLMEITGLRSTFPFDSSDRINWSRVLDHLITARVHQWTTLVTSWRSLKS